MATTTYVAEYTKKDQKVHSVTFNEASSHILNEDGTKSPVEKLLGQIYVSKSSRQASEAKRLRITVEVVE